MTMAYSRRSALAAAATGLASLAATGKQQTQAPNARAAGTEAAVSDLIQRSEQANAALMRGDVETYLGLIAVSDDFTLMSPFGGKPSRGPYSRVQWDRIGKTFKNGGLTQELVEAYGTADLVVLAVIEHCYGEVGGMPTQAWPLRVTLVYRRDDAQWLLVHRHADPLARGISLEQAASLARGGKNA
jgi:ketosteroid isomerase-like protein